MTLRQMARETEGAAERAEFHRVLMSRVMVLLLVVVCWDVSLGGFRDCFSRFGDHTDAMVRPRVSAVGSSYLGEITWDADEVLEKTSSMFLMVLSPIVVKAR